MSQTGPKLMSARPRVSAALQEASLHQFTREQESDRDSDADPKTRRRRRHPSDPPRSISAALQQLTGRF